MAKKVKPKKKNREKFILCDPAVCDHCMYIGEGYFICDKNGMAEEVFVMRDWEVTDDFMWCMSGGEPSGN